LICREKKYDGNSVPMTQGRGICVMARLLPIGMLLISML